MKKPATKRATAKASAKKPTSKKPSANVSNRDTLGKLRAHVDDIEKRLKRANSLTRTSVRALKSSYEALDGDNHASALTGHIEELSDRLTGMIEQTRTDVAHDLKIVLGDPRLETLSAALTKANQRLTSAEQNQAESINAINAHIAKLATVVDERMQRETREREKGQAQLTGRMDTLEHETADAIRTIGDKVVSVSEDITEKSQTLRGELAEQALTRQQDYEEHKHQIAQRIEAVEDEQRNLFPAFERDIETLSTRLEALETNVGMYNRPVEPIISAPAYEVAPQMSEEAPLAYDENAHYEDTHADDAFAALELVDMQEVSPPAPVYAGGPAQMPEQVTEQVSEQIPATSVMPQAYAPVEYGGEYGATAAATANDGQGSEVFSPRAYTPGAVAQAEPAVQTDLPTPYAVVDNGPQVYAPQTAPAMPQAFEAPQSFDPTAYNQAPPPMPANGPNAGVPPMPNTSAVPEIQTLEPSMESVRPGAEPNDISKKGKKGKKRKKRKIKKAKNDGGGGGHGMIRKVALFGGVAVVALFAYKSFAPKIFGADDTPQTTQAAPSKSLASVEVSGSASERPEEFTNPDGQKFESTEPVGDYTDTMAAPDLGEAGSKSRANQVQTLEAAAADGNAIAQFQLGLSHLESGRDADAVRLIRLAANQGQPAAQYRLAKLYEAGIGVKVNGKTAKDLLTRAARADNRIAMHDLGHYYASGADGSAPDLQQAVKWFSMAAERGVLDSQFNLAVLYQGGTGVPLSLEDAYVWFAIAAAQGDDDAAKRSQVVARELSKDALDKAEARVKTYAPKPVDNVANGVFKNLPWITQKEARLTPNKNISVTGAQQMLASLGYQVGKPDGTLGPNTRNAIINFERANGLPETGRVNAQLIERLQLAVGV